MYKHRNKNLLFKYVNYLENNILIKHHESKAYYINLKKPTQVLFHFELEKPVEKK